ncbi:hypothetical protein VNO78_20245 [Psophocarpus tetragonolobus]|uniref:Uncharacterized protein n=1 Tax=Psophocarpus tetragonolobus TaxID=3891 RepID=A0AAN9XGJ8_PSOTE
MTQKEQKWAQNFLTWSPICYTQSSKSFGLIWQYDNPVVECSAAKDDLPALLKLMIGIMTHVLAGKLALAILDFLLLMSHPKWAKHLSLISQLVHSEPPKSIHQRNLCSHVNHMS